MLMGENLTFPYGEGGPPQRWKRGLTQESSAILHTALAQDAPPQSGLRPASSPGGEAFLGVPHPQFAELK